MRTARQLEGLMSQLLEAATTTDDVLAASLQDLGILTEATILWDLDGALADAEPLRWTSYWNLAADLGVRLGGELPVLRESSGEAGVWAHLGRGHPGIAAQDPKILAKWCRDLVFEGLHGNGPA